MKSYIENRDGKKREVRNLGWLIRNWRAVESFRFEMNKETSRCDGLLIAHLRDGGKYVSEYASLSVCFNWLKRPIFQGQTLTIVSAQGRATTWVIGNARYKEVNRMTPYVAQRAVLLGLMELHVVDASPNYLVQSDPVNVAKAMEKGIKELAKEKSIDFLIEDQGSIVLFQPMSDAAKEWFSENVQSEGWQWMGPRLAVDHRPAQHLLEGIEAEGFTVGGMTR